MNIKDLLVQVKDKALAVVAYLGDAAHRRAVVGAGLMLGNHYLGWTNDEATILMVDAVLGTFLSMWSSRTPGLEEVKEKEGI